MDKFLASFWKSITQFFDTLADNSNEIFLTIVKILLIFIAAKLVIWLTNKTVRGVITRRTKKHPGSIFAKKSQTIAIVLQSVIRYTVYFIMVASILDQLKLGITAGSILATAGIGGVAIGLGAQGLIKDVASGFFLLFENQYSVGDYIEIRDATGTVEAITVRTTQIRAWTGEVIIVPNGSIDKVVNYSRGHIVAVVNVYVAQTADVQAAQRIMEECCADYKKAHAEVLEYKVLAGILEMMEGAIGLRALVNVVPMSQWQVERELKLLIYRTFEEKGIEASPLKRVVIDTIK